MMVERMTRSEDAQRAETETLAMAQCPAGLPQAQSRRAASSAAREAKTFWAATNAFPKAKPGRLRA
jgi:hypothetical protein